MRISNGLCPNRATLGFLAVLLLGLFHPNRVNALDVTIITHGLQFDNAYPDWIDSMATAVKSRTGTVNTAIIRAEVGADSHSNLGVTDFSLVEGKWPGSNSPTEHVVIKLFWHTVAGITDLISTGNIADQILPYLVNPLTINNGTTVPALAESPLHLIGHSRGSSLVAAVARRFGQHGIWVDQLTTLDPHPISGDESVIEYANVRFADDYFQVDTTGSFPISGNPVPGTEEIDLTTLFDQDLISDGGNWSDHIEVHDWYFGTIDETAKVVGGDPIPRSIWFQDYNTGFQYSLIADGQRLREMPELGSGGGLVTQGAMRSQVSTLFNTIQYPSIEMVNTNWTYNVTSGAPVNLLLRYVGAADTNSVVITVGLTSTLNPYAPFDSIIEITTNNVVGLKWWNGTRVWTPKVSDDGKYVSVRITAPTGRSRHFQLSRPFRVSPGLQLTWKPIRAGNNSGFDFIIHGTSDRRYVIEASNGIGADEKGWAILLTSFLRSSGPSDLNGIDVWNGIHAPLADKMFFRARYLP